MMVIKEHTNEGKRSEKDDQPYKNMMEVDGEPGLQARWGIDSDLHSEKKCSER